MQRGRQPLLILLLASSLAVSCAHAYAGRARNWGALDEPVRPGAPCKLSLSDRIDYNNDWRRLRGGLQSEGQWAANSKPAPLDPSLPPLVLFPGHSGSALNVSLVDADLPTYCERNSKGWERIWLNLRFLDPFKSAREEECWYRMMGQDFDPETNAFLSPRGVTVEAASAAGQSPQGGIDGVEYLVELLYGQRVGAYLHTLVTQLAAVGYVAGSNLYAVPYDWRVTPDSLEQHSSWFGDVTSLFERLREASGRPAIAIAHSMGNLQLMHLLRRKGDGWTKAHVGTLFSVSAPWAGAAKALRTLLSGDLLFYHWIARLPHFAVFDTRRVRDLAQGMGSVQWLAPSPALWPAGQPVVRLLDTGEAFDARRWGDLLPRLNRTKAAAIRRRVERLEPAAGLTPVPVELYCFAGVGRSTEVYYEYPSLEQVGDTEPATFCSDGDDTVPLHSLRACRLASSLGPPVLEKEYPGLSHTSILTAKALFADLIPAILAKRAPPPPPPPAAAAAAA